MIKTINPADGGVLDSYSLMSEAEIAQALESAEAAFTSWKLIPVEERCQLITGVGSLLRERAESLAQLMTAEMGKPIAQARSEVAKCALACDYYAENAVSILHAEEVPTEAGWSGVRNDPLGVTLAIMPWNFPLWQVIRCSIPALAAGNAVLLKHAPNVSGCATALENLFRDAGSPPDLFRSLFVRVDQVADLIRHKSVRAVTLTGSCEAGRAVAETAGRALKKSVLELGGSDPFIVFPDADLEAAVSVGVQSRMLNNGQSCIAAKRFLIHQRVAAEFRDRFVGEMSKIRMSDPVADSTRLGPLARVDLADSLDEQVQRSLQAGANLCCGGTRPDIGTAWYPATVLTDVRPGMPVFDEETFGPVAAFTVFSNEDEGLRLANHTCYGLGASLWTCDTDRISRLVPQLDAGMVCVNAMVKSDSRLPFGGIRDSGYGRELGTAGLLEFVNRKTVWVT